MNSKAKKMRIGGICAIAAALLLLGGGAFLLFNDSNEDTITPSDFAAVGEEDSATACQNLISKYYTAIMGEDAETLYKLMAPQEYWDYYMISYGKTEADIVDTYEDAINNTKAQWMARCGSDAKVSFQIEASGEQTEEFLTELGNNMNETIGSDAITVEEAMTLSVAQTVTGSNGTLEAVKTPTLVKINSSWYIIDEGIGS